MFYAVLGYFVDKYSNPVHCLNIEIMTRYSREVAELLETNRKPGPNAHDHVCAAWVQFKSYGLNIT